jgi:hypothetical protein
VSDLGFKGPKYAWINGQVGPRFTKDRLDHVVAKKEWCDPGGKVFIETIVSSDHSLVFLQVVPDTTASQCHGGFRYE